MRCIRWMRTFALALFVVLATLDSAAQTRRQPARAKPAPELPEDLQRPADAPPRAPVAGMASVNVRVDEQADDDGLRVALGEGRRTLLSVLTPASAARLGFDGVPADKDVKIVQGLAETMIQVQDVRDYAGGDPRPLLRSRRRIIFPIVVGNRVRAAMTVARIHEKWKVVSIGSAGLIRAVFNALLLARKQLPQPENVRWGVTHINGLNQYFVVAELGSSLFLVPMVRNAALQFEPGVPLDAVRVLKALQPAARAFRGGAPT